MKNTLKTIKENREEDWCQACKDGYFGECYDARGCCKDRTHITTTLHTTFEAMIKDLEEGRRVIIPLDTEPQMETESVIKLAKHNDTSFIFNKAIDEQIASLRELISEL